MKIDTERVIIEVHLRPCLWDKSHELYKNRDARDAAWKEILKEIAPNFDTMSDEEKKNEGMYFYKFCARGLNLLRMTFVPSGIFSYQSAKFGQKTRLFPYAIWVFLTRISSCSYVIDCST